MKRTYRSLNPEEFVYIITTEEEWPSKIGKSRDPWARLIDLQIGSPIKLKVYAAYCFNEHYSMSASSVEAAVKKELQEYEWNGREWYGVTALDMQRVLVRVTCPWLPEKPPSETGYIIPPDTPLDNT